MVSSPPLVLHHRLGVSRGWTLDVLELRPSGRPKATVILGHAMMVERRTLWSPRRPSLGETLRQLGFRILLPDLRGHGCSGPTPSRGGNWSYDDLVRDTGPLVHLARDLDDAPVVLVGHSLFGHTSLAWLGQHPYAPVAAVALVGVDVWNLPALPRREAWPKRALLHATTAVTRTHGYWPARRLGLGSADEARGYWDDLVRSSLTGRWASRTGISYREGLSQIRAPVLHVTSRGDRWLAPEHAALHFSAPLPHREVLALGRASAPRALKGLAPDHMELVTDRRSAPLWKHVGGWIGDVLGRPVAAKR